MEIFLYNTLSQKIEKFVPIDDRSVRMYVCGPTVYDYAHIGNARPVVTFDVLFRLLRYKYGRSHVTFVRNITDVDDKINDRAIREGISIMDLTKRTLEQFHKDVEELGTIPPTKEPRATKHISEMLDMIDILVEKKHAYFAQGHVLFRVSSMQDYGKLSKRIIEDMHAGARVEIAPYKENPMDFVLWKPSKSGEPSWKSKWGYGRPGWHIECSAMAKKHLGKIFDIHGGGIDLIFPHHENEIAQSRCAHDTKKMANFWMHNGFVQVEGEKMAKSVGNFITIHKLLTKWPGEVIRLALLLTHYRRPLNFTTNTLVEAKQVLDALYNASNNFVTNDKPDPEFLDALSNDLNTPDAITVLHQLKVKAKKGDPNAVKSLRSSGNILGILKHSKRTWFEWSKSLNPNIRAEVSRLLKKRKLDRKLKNFKISDNIRDNLAKKDIIVRESKNIHTGKIETIIDFKN